MTLAPYCQGPDWKPRVSTKVPGVCGACGVALVGRNHWFCPSPGWNQDAIGSCRLRWMQNHDWGSASREAMRRAQSRCLRCGNPAVEVNHIEPREGRGYTKGCHHHQEGLEPLCHQCHLAVTAEQRWSRGVGVPRSDIEIHPTLFGPVVFRRRPP